MRCELDNFELAALIWTYACIALAALGGVFEVSAEPIDTLSVAAFIGGLPIGCFAIGFSWRRPAGLALAALAPLSLAGLSFLKGCDRSYPGEECTTELIGLVVLAYGTPVALAAAGAGWLAAVLLERTGVSG